MATYLVGKDDLPHSGTAHRFDGHAFGDVGVSFFLTDAPPGTGPGLHRHPYAEVFVIQEGRVTFTVGDETVEATGGQIVIVPAGQPHKFVNAGAGPARHLDLHASGRMITEWLEG
jgi:mannose-6-phosphate isomerase-like protein (cupin superfamily)